MTELHNVTLYVARDAFDSVREFYATTLGLPVVFEEAGHICCFGVGEHVAVCVHEAEPGHAAGATELFFWVDGVDGDAESQLVDPLGNQIRLHVGQG